MRACSMKTLGVYRSLTVLVFDARSKRMKKYAFSNENEFVWRGGNASVDTKFEDFDAFSVKRKRSVSKTPLFRRGLRTIPLRYVEYIE